MIGFVFRGSIRPRVSPRFWATRRNGHWRFFPEEEVVETRRRYRGDSLILETEIETKSGAVRLIDFMPPRGENPDIVRIVEGLRGKVSMQMELVVRFDYGQIVPWVRHRNGGLEAIAGPDGLILRTPIETRGKDLTTVAEFTVSEGERVPFVLTWFASHKDPPRAIHHEHALRDTEKYWREWSSQFQGRGEMARCSDALAHRAQRIDLRADGRPGRRGHDIVT